MDLACNLTAFSIIFAADLAIVCDVRRYPTGIHPKIFIPAAFNHDSID